MRNSTNSTNLHRICSKKSKSGETNWEVTEEKPGAKESCFDWERTRWRRAALAISLRSATSLFTASSSHSKREKNWGVFLCPVELLWASHGPIAPAQPKIADSALCLASSESLCPSTAFPSGRVSLSWRNLNLAAEINVMMNNQPAKKRINNKLSYLNKQIYINK